MATRALHLRIDDGTTILLNINPATTQAASITDTYNYIEGGPKAAISVTNTAEFIPLQNQLFAGFRIFTATSLIQAGDDLSAPQLLVEEWIEP